MCADGDAVENQFCMKIGSYVEHRYLYIFVGTREVAVDGEQMNEKYVV